MEHDEATLATYRPATINSKYAAFATKYGISVRVLDSGDEHLSSIASGRVTSRAKPVLALSLTQLSRLAISSGDQTLVYDVQHGTTTQVLLGAGRAVTAIAWSRHDTALLATGAVDGSVQIWTLTQAWRPLHRLSQRGTPCTEIAWSPLSPGLLGVADGGTVVVWTLGARPRIVEILSVGRHRITNVVWHASHGSRLLTSSSDSVLRVWDVTGALQTSKVVERDGDSDEIGFFGEPDGVHKPVYPIVQIQLPEIPIIAGWVGEYGTYVLLDKQVLIYSYGSEFEMPHEVWRLELGYNAMTALIRDLDGVTMLTVTSQGSVASYRIPPIVLDSVGGHAESLPPNQEHLAQESASSTGGLTCLMPLLPLVAGTNLRMSPVSIAQLRAEKGSSEKTASQLQQRRRTDSQRSRQTAITAIADFAPSTVTSPTRAMTSSLELPKQRGEDDDSPMPFLSPSIPARRPSPNTLPPIEDIPRLQPLQGISFESMPTTAAHDSDSDDDTFADGMQGSGIFLPGGINVPLPKACGALFAPSGQLLVFSPPKPQTQALQATKDVGTAKTEQRAEANKIASLFPIFGNLAADDRTVSEALDSDGSDSSVAELEVGLPTFALQLSSFQSQRSWNTQASPVKPAFGPMVDDQHQVIVTAYDISLLLPACLAGAEGYRILCEESENGSDLSRHNANVAERAGLGDTADVWRLVATLLEHKIGENAPVDDNGIGTVPEFARRSALHPRNGQSEVAGDDESCGKPVCADPTLAKAWLIEQIFQWAERNANVQMLALVSAVLAGVEASVSDERTTARHPTTSKPSTYNNHHDTYSNTTRAPISTARPAPILRSNSNQTIPTSTSPTKLRQPFQTLSRNPSQPHLDPSPRTPALPFPNASTKLPSASPETHRSSFSAAAKSYAQSITDKFASTYGTSPPVRKAGTSPGELATSLTGAGGSWGGKSVSFASVSSFARAARVGRGYTGEEEEDGGGDDSDRTIEDGSLPHTPKSGGASVELRLPNQCLFSTGASSGQDRVSLLSPELAVKAVLWRRYYAEQLRCWGLWLQAAELENVAGGGLSAEQNCIATTPPVHQGVAPTRAPGQRKASCSICASVIVTLEQLCAVCLHTTHLGCLGDYLVCLEEGEVYECPTGCGCACAELPFVAVEFAGAGTGVAAEMGRGGVKRKASFTDPRRWRAKVEGDSW
ncbi:hypothetical protein LTR08_003005 [Meristemomyces frigidus]|nr:hypothetical protein LTR08_003005 [Meristemomyces frigidus]